MNQPLHAPLEISFDYTRSLGPTLGEFVTALAGRRILGARASDGRVHAQPLRHPFGWALIRLDGADTAMLHAVNAGSADRMRTGMRVRPRWADRAGTGITDIVCFEAEEDATTRDGHAETEPGEPVEPAEPVTMITTPIRLSYDHTVSPGESSYLLALAQGRLIGQRCPACGKVYLPPRGACPVDGVPTRDEVQLPDTGIVTTFCVVNVPFQGQRVPTPYVAASVLIDGADIAFQHLILGCPPDEVRMGMRVRAVWKPREQWDTGAHNIDNFEPTGEPDAPYDSYAHHL